MATPGVMKSSEVTDKAQGGKKPRGIRKPVEHNTYVIYDGVDAQGNLVNVQLTSDPAEFAKQALANRDRKFATVPGLKVVVPPKRTTNGSE